MPSKAYIKFQNNLQTVQRLNETYEQMKKTRNSRGRGAFDHITRSSIVFLISAFEVYCEDIIREGVQKTIVSAKDASNLPKDVKNTIDNFVKNEKNGIPPIELCDEGWRNVYKNLIEKLLSAFNTPKKDNLKDLFKRFLGIKDSALDKIADIDKLDDIVKYRGEIVHQVKAIKYVHIEDVKMYITTIHNIAINIDLIIRKHIKSIYKVKAPWNDTYTFIA